MMDYVLLVFLFLLLVPSSVLDFRQHRIPNAITIPIMASAMVYSMYINGLTGFMNSAGGLLLGIAFLLPFYICGGMGAGDVKLMGAIGSILGPHGTFIAFLCSAVVGGLYALFVLCRSRTLSNIADRYGMMIRDYLMTGHLTYIPSEPGKLPPLSYGIAISLGTFLSVLRPL